MDLKVKKILEKFLQPNFKLKNDVYLNSLLTHISDGSLKDRNVESQLWLDWIVEALTLWEKTKIPSLEISSFYVNLTSLLSSNESNFNQLQNGNVYERIISLLNLSSSEIAPTLKLGFIKLLDSFLKHESGKEFLANTQYWSKIIDFVLARQTIYIAREGNAFLANLLTTIKSNEKTCSLILSKMTSQLGSCLPSKENGIVEVNEEGIQRNITPTLLLLGEILQVLLKQAKANIIIINILEEQFNLKKTISNILSLIKSPELAYDLSKILFILPFFEMSFHESLTVDIVRENLKKLLAVIQNEGDKKRIINAIKLAHLGLIYWKETSLIIPNENMKCYDEVRFENQMLAFFILPVKVVSLRQKSRQSTSEDLDEFRDDFIMRLFRIVGKTTLRTAYQYRDCLFNDPNIFEHALTALSYLLKSKAFYSRNTGAVIFQVLIYSLKDIVEICNNSPEQVFQFNNQPNYMGLHLDCLAEYIETFELTWKDSVETICVMNISFQLLKIPNWSTKIVVKALKLVDISITKYMSPNLALLVDRVSDSTLGCMAPFIYTKLHDASWEVRDSALEVLCSICRNANTEFVSLQKVILDSDLPTLVVQMALNDSESYVRTSALKCLRELVQVEELWNNLQSKNNIYVEVLGVLQRESEGMVRTEAVNLIRTIYMHKKFPKEMLIELYNLLSEAVSSDFHWEVKVAALCFWEQVIENHLKNQGMIDGAFPNFTFSTEHKKIVKLDEREIKKRLIKLMFELSNVGCLSVLVKGIKDEEDFEVSKKALQIAEKLVKLLHEYEIKSIPLLKTNPDLNEKHSATTSEVKEKPEFVKSEIKKEIGDFETIMEDILNTNDANLLSNVLNIKKEPSFNYLGKGKEVLDPNDFLSYLKGDLGEVLSKKKDWLEDIDGVESLLDDILKDYQNDGVNSMDCY